MATLSLREAAERAGTSKSTIFRAIKAGRLSAARTDDGGFAIDPAELFRVYPPKVSPVATGQSAGQWVGQDASPSGTTGITHDPELVTRLAVAEVELRHLREMVDELRTARNSWQGQAERATFALTDQRSRAWWRRLVG